MPILQLSPKNWQGFKICTVTCSTNFGTLSFFTHEITLDKNYFMLLFKSDANYIHPAKRCSFIFLHVEISFCFRFCVVFFVRVCVCCQMVAWLICLCMCLLLGWLVGLGGHMIVNVIFMFVCLLVHVILCVCMFSLYFVHVILCLLACMLVY